MTCARDEARLRLLGLLGAAGYGFVAPTPATHRRNLRRRGEGAMAADLRDVFGWSLPFRPDTVGRDLVDTLEAAEALEPCGAALRSRLRVASLGADLFLHSAFPVPDDGVFFGPDSYRFARFLAAQTPVRGEALLDLGCGAGVGAVAAARLMRPDRLVLSDINPQALSLARVNLAAAGLHDAEFIESDGLQAVDGDFDVIVSNPPFMANAPGRTYCDGGGLGGTQRSLDWGLAAAARLRPGGRVLLYTASPIQAGEDRLRQALERGLDPARNMTGYEELDPDIFGEALGGDAYAGVERLAAIGAVIAYAPARSCAGGAPMPAAQAAAG